MSPFLTLFTEITSEVTVGPDSTIVFKLSVVVVGVVPGVVVVEVGVVVARVVVVGPVVVIAVVLGCVGG